MKFREAMESVKSSFENDALQMLKQGIVDPAKAGLLSELCGVTTTVGSFIVEKWKGRYQRCVSLYITPSNQWMDEAFHMILRRDNNLEKCSNHLIMVQSVRDKENTYYQLAPGAHVLKYRHFNVLVNVDEQSSSAGYSDYAKSSANRTYSIITFDLSDEFPRYFNTDMLKYRNLLLKIDPDSKYVNVYSNTVSSYSDTYSAWSYVNRIPKKPVEELYIPNKSKVKLFNELNTFFAERQMYRDRGITPNYVIVLYGPAGPQPISEQIPIHDGWKKMGDLEIGDRVWTAEWKPTTITNIRDYDEMDVYEVTVVRSGMIVKTRCAITHKWPVVKNMNEFLMTMYNGEKGDQVQLDVVDKTTDEVMDMLAVSEDSVMLNPITMQGNIWSIPYVVDIKKLDYKEKMRCITVDDPSHLYLTNGYIPTCNSGKDSVARTIASAYNRNLYLPNSSNGGKFIPRSIEANVDNLNINSPMFLISDIDKYPYLINEQPTVSVDTPDDTVRERVQNAMMVNKGMFNRMINALDGIMTGDGWIIVMTTNHIEAFSDTFLRDGRVDLCMEIGYVTPEVMRNFVWRNYHIALPKTIKLKDDKLVMSTVMSDFLYRKMKSDEFLDKYVEVA